jgi:nucleotide-binding universal stress UspA family protein
MKVLVGVDESEYSSTAIRFISEIAWPSGSRFLILSACQPIFMGPGEVAAPDTLAEILSREEARHDETANRAATRLRKAGLIAEARTARGSAENALVDTARSEHADLIVVGSHGRTGFKKLLLGSVASHVVTHAPCSVLVVKQRLVQDQALQGSGREPGKKETVKVKQSMACHVASAKEGQC